MSTDADQLARIEAKIDRLIQGNEPDVMTAADVMELMGLNSRTALHRLRLRLGLKPFVRGKYRRKEVQTAIARQTLNSRLAINKS